MTTDLGIDRLGERAYRRLRPDPRDQLQSLGVIGLRLRLRPERRIGMSAERWAWVHPGRSEHFFCAVWGSAKGVAGAEGCHVGVAERTRRYSMGLDLHVFFTPSATGPRRREVKSCRKAHDGPAPDAVGEIRVQVGPRNQLEQPTNIPSRL